MANISTILSNALTVHLRGYLSGLVLSTAGSSATFSVASGVAVDDVQKDFMNLATAISKTTSAWAVGNNNGGIDTGAVANSTWYHVYLIKRPDTGVVDVLFSLSASSPTMPTNYTLKRRIGSMKTNGSAQWILFSQNGDEFLWSALVQDSTTLPTATAALYTLSTPLGIKTNAIISINMDHVATGGNVALYVTSPDQSDEAVGAPGSAGAGSMGIFATAVANAAIVSELQKRTNTSSQIRIRSNTTVSDFFLNTYGWVDTRGKL